MRRLWVLVILLAILSTIVLGAALAKKITSEDELIGGPAADGKIGDYLMKNEKIAVIIGDKENYHGYMRSGGNVLDAALVGTHYDLLDEFHTYFGWPKQLIAEKIEIVNDGSNGKAAIIKVTGHHSHIDGVKVTSWYILDSGVDYLKIVTKLENHSGKDLKGLVLGDAAFFGYARAFLWGKGFTINKADTLLLGAQGDGVAYGFTTTEYDPEKNEMRKIHIAYIFTDPEVKRVDLKNGESVTYERIFFVSRDLASIQREILDMRGIEYTLLEGYVIDDEGNTLANVPVEILDENGVVYSIAYTDAAGKYEVPLLKGKEYTVRLNVEGMETVKELKVLGVGTKYLTKPLVAKFVDKNELAWGPYINKIGKDFVEISWRSVVPSSGKVVLCGIGEYTDGKISKIHHVRIEGLKPGTEYTYKVVLGSEETKGIETEKYTFRTFEEDPDHFRFIVYGDTRTYNKRHKFVVSRMLKYDPAFVINVGDLVMDGRITSDWDGFFWAIKDLSARYPYLVSHGNHEYNSIYFYEAFNIPYNRAWYSFDYGNAHFIVLNADVLLMQKNEELMKEQTEWLIRDLEAHKDAKFKFVFYHEPFWTNCIEYGEEGVSPTIDWWKPIFEKYGVTIVFNSHYHLYERFFVDGIPYVTTGGGGGPLYLKVKEEKVPGTQKIVTGYHHFLVVDVYKDRVEVKVVAVAKQLDKKKEDAFQPIEDTIVDEFTVKK